MNKLFLVLASCLLWVSSAWAAITMNPLTSGSDTSNSSSYATASITIHANRLALLSYQNARDAGTSGVPSPSSTGVTWHMLPTSDHISYHTNVTPTRRLTVFYTMASADQTGVITVSHGGVTQDGAAWSVVEFAGVQQGGTDGSAAIVFDDAASGGSAATQVTCTLNAFQDATNNVAFGAFGTSQAAGIAPGSGFTEIHDVTYATPSNEVQTEWRTGEDPTVDATFGAADCGCQAVEIKVNVVVTMSPAIFDDED